jgi:hypothetical protein
MQLASVPFEENILMQATFPPSICRGVVQHANCIQLVLQVKLNSSVKSACQKDVAQRNRTELAYGAS